MESRNNTGPVILHGIVGSSGSCAAKAYVFRRRIDVEKYLVDPSLLDKELERLEVAIELTRKNIIAAQKEALDKHGAKYAAIFDSHLLMLTDPQFKPQMIRRLRAEKVNIESIVQETVDCLHTAFSAIEDKYLRERAIDIKDVGDSILRHLMGLEGPAKEIGNEPFVLIANEITPSELLDFAKGRLKGICLESGGSTSHVAILAGALSIPSIFGIVDLSRVTRTGDPILVDTQRDGLVILCPDETAIAEILIDSTKQPDNQPLSNITTDRVAIILGANVARIEELAILEKLQITRIGLFRSEFLFMESMDLPSESFQESVYRQVVKAAPENAVLRTIDVGSDKPVKYLPFPKEVNPAMGYRSIRFSLSRPDILLPQLRAMIRASEEGNTRIIFPMVSTPDELEQIDKIFRTALEQAAPAKPPSWGIMVEVPSAIFMLEQIRKYTDYISLGTNDLLQFFYGIDRTNEKLASLAGHLCIPFLRLLFYCVATAKSEGIRVGICGEMASDPTGFLALVGIGFDEFSMRPAAFSAIKQMIPKMSQSEIRIFTQEILAEGGTIDIKERMAQAFPKLASFLS